MGWITNIIMIIIIADIELSSCVWNVNNDLPKNDPIYYKTGREGAQLIIPNSDRGLELSDNEIISLSCWGGRNKIIPIKRDKVRAKCIRNNQVLVEGRESNISNLECDSSVSASAEMTNRTCAKGKGKIIQVGYNSMDDEWLELYHSCYDERNFAAIYTQHVVHGAGLGAYYKNGTRKHFRLPKLKSKHPINEAYTKKSEKKVFENLLGKKYAEQYIDDKSYLAKGHLAPHADFILNSWQQATYLLSNVVPEWQSLNRANWVNLENLIRKKALTTKDDLKVVTGGVSVLSFQNSTNQKTEIYLLPDKKLPVPEFMFKIVYSESRQEGIGFFMLNNPFAESLDRSFCASICKESGWWQTNWEKISKGHIQCCHVDTVFSAVEIAPLLHGSRVMRL